MAMADTRCMPLQDAPVRFPEVERLIHRLCDLEPSLLGDMLAHHMLSGGKQLRPYLLLGLADCLQLPRSAVVGWASACEMLHNGSLIHDDLQDQDRFRRGLPTVWHQFGVANAVNAGNYLLLGGVQAIEACTLDEAIKYRLALLYSYMATEIVQGQSREFELSQYLACPELPQRYLECIRQKTAALFAYGAEGLGYIETPAGTWAPLYHELFTLLGEMFQIQDDVLDLYGEKGRDLPGCDIREGKVSALVVQLLQAQPEAVEWVAPILAKPYEKTEPQDIMRLRHAFDQAHVLERLAFQVRQQRQQIHGLIAQRDQPGLGAWVSTLQQHILAPISHLEPFQGLGVNL